MSGSVSLEVRGQVAVVTLANEARRNAVDLAMAQALVRAADELAGRDDIGAVMLRGAGQRAFCAGLDVTYARETGDSAQAIRAISATLDTFMARLRGLDLPSVAMLHGACYGGGLHLAIDTDFRFADDRVACAVPAIRNGLYYPIAALVRLRDLCGPTRMARLLLEGEPVGAATLLAWGVVDEVHAPEHLEQAALAFAARLAGQPRQAVRDYRAIFRAIHAGHLDEAVRLRGEALQRTAAA
jgi:enoyl-CoA hydratase/carnithine racemase